MFRSFLAASALVVGIAIAAPAMAQFAPNLSGHCTGDESFSNGWYFNHSGYAHVVVTNDSLVGLPEVDCGVADQVVDLDGFQIVFVHNERTVNVQLDITVEANTADHNGLVSKVIRQHPTEHVISFLGTLDRAAPTKMYGHDVELIQSTEPTVRFEEAGDHHGADGSFWNRKRPTWIIEVNFMGDQAHVGADIDAVLSQMRAG